MSIDLIAAALWLPLESNRKLVLVSLCENADAKGICFPGLEYIAARASISTRRASSHLHALEMAGLARVIRKSRGPNQHTIRLLSVKRILTEGEQYRRAFMERNLPKDDLQGELIPDESSGIASEGMTDETSGIAQSVLLIPDDRDGIQDDRDVIEDTPRQSNRQVEPSVEPSVQPPHNAREAEQFRALTQADLDQEWLQKRGALPGAIAGPPRLAGARR